MDKVIIDGVEYVPKEVIKPLTFGDLKVGDLYRETERMDGRHGKYFGGPNAVFIKIESHTPIGWDNSAGEPAICNSTCILDLDRGISAGGLYESHPYQPVERVEYVPKEVIKPLTFGDLKVGEKFTLTDPHKITCEFIKTNFHTWCGMQMNCVALNLHYVGASFLIKETDGVKRVD